MTYYLVVHTGPGEDNSTQTAMEGIGGGLHPAGAGNALGIVLLSSGVIFLVIGRDAPVCAKCQETEANLPDPPAVRPPQVPPVVTSRPTQSPQCPTDVPTNIVFLKVHKSGSTTVANLLARYAINHDLNIALPNKPVDVARFNYFAPFRTQPNSSLPVAKGQEYNVLFNHMIFNHSAIARFMPTHTFYCAIMREPLSRFLSSANYYYYLLPIPLRQYLLLNYTGVGAEPNQSLAVQFPQGLASALTDQVKRSVSKSPELYNSIALDSGMPPLDQMDPKAVQAHLQKLDRELDLMMVMERFEESLVLLKRRACLHTKDIVFFQLNSAKKHRVRILTDADRQVLRTWQMADHVLYDHFYNRFEEEVRREGQSFSQEVEQFRDVLTRVQTFCGSREIRLNDVLVIKASQFHGTFTLNSEDCNIMQYKELDFQKKLVARAQRRLLEGASQ